MTKPVNLGLIVTGKMLFSGYNADGGIKIWNFRDYVQCIDLAFGLTNNADYCRKYKYTIEKTWKRHSVVTVKHCYLS